MNERTGVCVDCSTTFVAGARGVLPARCPECTRTRRREQEKGWTSARPPRPPKVHHIACDDCTVEFSWSGRGLPPGRCAECAKKRRLAANRERGRIRRAAAKNGDSRRLGVCIECMEPFEGLPRGSISKRCPSCTEKWNKVRYKQTVGRTEGIRQYDLRTKYGMSPEDWDQMFDAQGGRCAICKRDERLRVDHCHDSGKVRGLLCHGCNTSLGHMKDDPEAIRSAADYVERHRSATVA